MSGQHGCWFCQDHRLLVDPNTGQEVVCPECRGDGHYCPDYEVEVGSRPHRNGAFQRWTQCSRCGTRLSSPTWDSIL